eukprot:scaffold51873_cov69-Phaeocystis_antarctica.AAC.3
MVAEHAPHRHLWPHGKMRCVGGSTQHTMQRWSPDASDAGTDSLIALGGTSSNGGGGYTTVSSSNATGSRTDQTAKQNLPRNKRGTPQLDNSARGDTHCNSGPYYLPPAPTAPPRTHLPSPAPSLRTSDLSHLLAIRLEGALGACPRILDVEAVHHEQLAQRGHGATLPSQLALVRLSEDGIDASQRARRATEYEALVSLHVQL